MSTLQARIALLITAIGADIKAMQQAAVNQYNISTASQSGFAADTYLAGSNVSIPQGKIKVGSIYRCKFNVVKTGAGVVAPIVTVRVGAAGAIGDTSRAALTFAAQTGVIDEGTIQIDCVFRIAGAVAVIQAMGTLVHRLAITGLSTSGSSSVINTGGAFDVTGSTLKIGVSVNGGTSAAWTVTLVQAELVNLTP